MKTIVFTQVGLALLLLLLTKYLAYIFYLGFTVHLLFYYSIAFFSYVVGILSNLWQNNFLWD